MRLRKFQADTIREAVARVKAELGPDAIIVSTKEVRKGLLGTAVEVTAALDPPEPSALEPLGRAAQGTPALPGLTESDIERIIGPLRTELRALRARLSDAPIPTVDPGLRRELSELRAELGRAAGPRGRDDRSLAEIAEGGGLTATSTGRVLALVGPTGAGKTTTLAKLAAREALGRRRMVALVTVDSYRVGGQEQIQTYADIIGVPLVVVHQLDSLPAAVDELAAYAKIFIDTAGRSPRDLTAIEELRAALAGVSELELHLALPASSSPAAVDTWVQRWRGAPLRRLVFTKVDEAETPEELVRAPARHRIPVSYVTTGQRVPEDIEEADSDRLLAMARGEIVKCEEAA